jgi:hypothetical protein
MEKKRQKIEIGIYYFEILLILMGVPSISCAFVAYKQLREHMSLD